MSNFLRGKETLGVEYKTCQEAVRMLLPALIETISELNKQAISDYFNNKLEKRTDRVNAKMSIQAKAGIDARKELLDYLRGIL